MDQVIGIISFLNKNKAKWVINIFTTNHLETPFRWNCQIQREKKTSVSFRSSFPWGCVARRTQVGGGGYVLFTMYPKIRPISPTRRTYIKGIALWPLLLSRLNWSCKSTKYLSANKLIVLAWRMDGFWIICIYKGDSSESS